MLSKSKQSLRLIAIFERLNNGEEVNKSALAQEYNVSEKTIQRDLDELRAFFADSYRSNTIQYDRTRNSYSLEKFDQGWLRNVEVLALCKVLLESRAFNKKEMNELIDKLLLQISPADCPHVEKLIGKERVSYVEPRHGKDLLELIWVLSEHIADQDIIEIKYCRQDGKSTKRKIEPVGVLFSEFYFYLLAYIPGKRDYPYTYRVDRIDGVKGGFGNFSIPYKDRFQDGEFRDRVQFMYSGSLQTVVFEYSGPSLEAIQDRLPTSKIINEKDGVHTVVAESFGDGIYMFLDAQGEKVRIVSKQGDGRDNKDSAGCG